MHNLALSCAVCLIILLKFNITPPHPEKAVLKAYYVVSLPLNGLSKCLHIRMLPLGDLGVNDDKAAFDTGCKDGDS